MLFDGNSTWAFLWSLIVHVIDYIFHYFWRFFGEICVENECIMDDLCEKSDEISVNKHDEEEEIKIPKVENEVGNVCNASTSKYQFYAGNSVCAFIEEPQTVHFTIHEMFLISHDDESHPSQVSPEKEDYAFDVDFGRFSVDLDDNSLSHDSKDDFYIPENDDCGEFGEEEEVVKQGKTEFSVSDHGLVRHEASNIIDDEMFVKEEVIDQSDQIVENNEYSDQIEVHSSTINSDDLGVISCSFKHDDCDELSEEEVLKQGKTEDSVYDLGLEEQDNFSFNKDGTFEKDEVVIHHIHEIVYKKGFDDEVQSRPSLSESDDFWASIHKYDDLLGSNEKFDCDIDNILCHKISAEALEPKTPVGIGDIRVLDYDYDQISPNSVHDFPIDQISSKLDHVNVESEHEGVESTYIELEPQSCRSSNVIKDHLPQEADSDSEDHELDQESEVKGMGGEEKCYYEEDVEEQMESDVVLEPKDLIRQMKKEMRQLKISGLPTILEESESPRVEQDLRPLRIDERIGHKDRMDEIQTFYRRYLDKMRKLDILSQQTMYAIGLLQLKNQDLILNKKVSVPAIKSLLAQNFWSNKLRKHDPVQKLIRDLQTDLELVYVGQLCLSWEMLKWQNHKAEELQAHDPDGFRQHNHVAGEFQNFQVLLQRFTEDEPFHQGPRVQHYVKTRCSLPALLQVPLVKDDARSEWRRTEEGGISVKMLKEVIGAAMSSFWEFLHADKDEACAIPLMGIHSVQVVLQDPSDADLLTETRSSLQKKEKRLKDLVKSGNCIVKKFKKHQDQRLSHEMLVAQVELRLVSRVLSMPKLSTNQLLWCHKKLNRIDIIGRKIYLEYYFLLFPG